MDKEGVLALFEINNELSMIDSFDELCRQAVHLARTRLSFDRIGIWFKKENTNEVTGSFGTDEKGRIRDERESKVCFDDKLYRQVDSLKAPKVLKKEGTLYDDKGGAVGKGNWACAALWCGSRTIGYIITDNLFSGRPVNTRLLALFAATFGHLCSLKKTKEALARSEERYRELWDDAPVAYHTLDTKGIITRVNKTEALMLGYKQEEMVGRPIFDHILPKQRKEARRRFLLKIAGKKVPKSDDRIYVRKDGTTMIVSVNDRLEKDSSGRIVGVRTTMVDITEQKNAERVVKQLAYTDQVTGLSNRIYFNERLAAHIQYARRFRHRFAMAFFDLDYFKRINDTLGHVTGDKLLKEIAGRLAGLLRRGDTVSRMGGDEFLILLPDVRTMRDMKTIAQKILEVLSKPVYLDGHILTTTASLGAAFFPSDGKDGETLLRSADIAMYEAKKSGRNTWCVYQKVSAALKNRIKSK